MALVKCRECGKQISSDAEACPSCGRKKPKATSTLTWIIAGIFAFSIITAISNSGKSEDAEAARLAAMTPEQRASEATVKAATEKRSSAQYACKEFVKRSLNDPDAAQFDDASAYFTEKQAVDKFRVEVTVRAKNGFNALRHITVNCVTQQTGGKWFPVFVKEIT
ncbi:MAG TPA: hypothetical protein VGL34_24990 [Steroidobacteraceae bacterium]|jgi:hypothetical protein